MKNGYFILISESLLNKNTPRRAVLRRRISDECIQPLLLCGADSRLFTAKDVNYTTSDKSNPAEPRTSKRNHLEKSLLGAHKVHNARKRPHLKPSLG